MKSSTKVTHIPTPEEVRYAHGIEVEDSSAQVIDKMLTILNKKVTDEVKSQIALMKDVLLDKYGLRAYVDLGGMGKLAYNTDTDKWRVYPSSHDTRFTKYPTEFGGDNIEPMKPIQPRNPLELKLKKLNINV